MSTTPYSPEPPEDEAARIEKAKFFRLQMDFPLAGCPLGALLGLLTLPLRLLGF